jgi:hypothetical protein
LVAEAEDTPVEVEGIPVGAEGIPAEEEDIVRDRLEDTVDTALEDMLLEEEWDIGLQPVGSPDSLPLNTPFGMP